VCVMKCVGAELAQRTSPAAVLPVGSEQDSHFSFI